MVLKWMNAPLMRTQKAQEKLHWESQQHPEHQDVQEEFTHLLTSPELVQNHQQRNLTCFRTLKSRKIRTHWHPWQPQACIKYIDEAIIINETAQGQNKKLFPGPMHQTKLAISLRSTGSIWRGKSYVISCISQIYVQRNNSVLKDDLRASMPRGGVNHLPVLSCSRIHPPSHAYQPPANLRQKCRQKKKSTAWTTRCSSSRCCSHRHVRQTGLLRVWSTWSIWWGKKFCHHTCLETPEPSPARVGSQQYRITLTSDSCKCKVCNFWNVLLHCLVQESFTYTRMSLRKAGCSPIPVGNTLKGHWVQQ